MRARRPLPAAVAVLAGSLLGQPAPARATPLGPKPVEIDVDGGRMVSMSPDGELLAFLRDGRHDLCLFHVATETDVGCVDLDERNIQLDEDSVTWSPDSTQLAFTELAFVTLRDGDLWAVGARDGQLTNVTDDGFEGELPIMSDEDPPADPVYIDVAPAWAPDGRSITFSRSPLVGGDFAGNVVANVDLGTGAVETLVDVSDEPGVVYRGTEWSPDGEHFYFSVGDPDVDDEDNGVWVYDAATASARLLVPGDATKGPPSILEVSSTGRFGLVRFAVFDARGRDAVAALAVADLETGALQPIAGGEGDDDGRPTSLAAAAFAPGDDRLLYGIGDPDGSRYFVRDVTTGGPAELVGGLHDGPFRLTLTGGPSWASDGRAFVPIDVDRALLVSVG